MAALVTEVSRASRRPFRLRLLGIGAMNSPRYAPAGLLVECGGSRVMIDGGPASVSPRRLDAWLLTDERSELAPAIRRLGTVHGTRPRVGAFFGKSLQVSPQPVIHTSHPTVGYLIEAEGRRVVWAPEFLVFPKWAAGADLMFAEAAGWRRPIRFAGGTGGHAAALDVAREARTRGVRRLVFAHVGRPTIRALDRGERPPFGEIGRERAGYAPRPAVRAPEGGRSMKRPARPFRRILAPVDFSPESLRALRHAAGLAASFDAELVLLHVVGPVHYLTPLGGRVPERPFPALDEAKRAALDALERLSRRFRGRVPRLRVEIDVGRPAERIVERADALKADLVVMGTHGRTGGLVRLLGSVAAAVVRTSARPVMTVPPAVRRPAAVQKRRLAR